MNDQMGLLTMEHEKCPFCGSTNLRVKPIWKVYRFVNCLHCKACGPVMPTEEEAWTAWDAREVDNG